MSKFYDIMWEEKSHRTETKITEEEIKAIHGLGLSVAQVIFGKTLQEIVGYNPSN